MIISFSKPCKLGKLGQCTRFQDRRDQLSTPGRLAALDDKIALVCSADKTGKKTLRKTSITSL